VKEIKSELKSLGVEVPSNAKKAQLVELLNHESEKKPAFVSSEDAALEKARSGENLSVEHIAELGPSQARKARESAETRLSKTFLSSEDAAREKARSGENLAVEHIAELGPSQTRKAREGAEIKSGSSKLSVKEIKSELKRLGVDIPSKAKKAELVELLNHTSEKKPTPVSPEDAAMELARSGEKLSFEHIAELAPLQVRQARSRVLFPDAVDSNDTKKAAVKGSPVDSNGTKKAAVKRSPTQKESSRRSKRMKNDD
jgi:hypothetical protein